MTTQEMVSQALDNATDNGYEFEAWTFLEVAEDLVLNDAELEYGNPEEIAPMVKSWFITSDVLYRMYE